MKDKSQADFSGYASKAGLLCSDGRTIDAHAFKSNDGEVVPLLWGHMRDDPDKVLGHALLEDREDGTYVYGFFNDSNKGKISKELVRKGDVNALSIFANKLVHRGSNVVKGLIHEVSLVLRGANPGASIQNVSLSHADGTPYELESEAWIFTDLPLEHSLLSDSTERGDMADENQNVDLVEHADTGDDRTVKDVLDGMTPEQRATVDFLLEDAIQETAAEYKNKTVEHSDSSDDADTTEEVEDAEDSDDSDESADDADSDTDSDDLNHEDTDADTLIHNQEDNNMSRNVFEQDAEAPKFGKTLNHDQLSTILSDAKKNGSLKDSFLEHAAEYGFGEDIDILFPDAKTLSNQPELIARRMEWVTEVIDKARHAPFSKIKTIVADITADEARARGYVKGNLKKEEIVKLLKRKTGPTTIYKKQKLDRDDIIDITDLDVVAWLKAEMRIMLDEELARAILVGDGRAYDDEDKIDDESIRPIATDDDMFAHKVTLPTNASVDDKIEALVRARAEYRGTGTPVFFTTLEFLTDILLSKDKMGRRIYGTKEEVASAIMASRIIDVELLNQYPEIVGIYVNMADYTIGADKGGSVSFFDDFDIDYNQFKYLLETRVSGALTKPKSAIVVKKSIGTAVTPQQPGFNSATNTITIPVVEGVEYTINSQLKTGTVVITEDTDVVAHAKAGFTIPAGTPNRWTYTFNESAG